MPDRLYFTESDDANALIASDPMALLIGFGEIQAIGHRLILPRGA